MKKKSLLGESMLLLAAFLWGFAFIAQSIGGETLDTFTFNGLRMMIGGITLLPLVYMTYKKERKKNGALDKNYRFTWIRSNRITFFTGLLCGIILFIACNLQQIGLNYSTASKAGFLTALYIVIVPIASIFLHKRPNINVFISIGIAMCGIYFLCVTDSFRITSGDILFLLCAVAFAAHILVIDQSALKVNAVLLSCVQFFVCGILSLTAMILFEEPNITTILHTWAPLLYTGVLSCGIAYTLQILGQKKVNPIIATLIMSLESVFSAIGGWIILNESLSYRELTGCILLFSAIILAQVPMEKLIKLKANTNN